MSGCFYKYRFADHVEMTDIEETLLVAAIAAEAIHGRAGMNLDADFDLDWESRTCHVDANSDVGRDLARVFVGLLASDVGEKAFTTMRSGPMVAAP